MNIGTKVVEYLEELPSSCPPTGCGPLAPQIVLRLVENDPPILKDFLSYAANGDPIKGDISPCEHASCSTFLNNRRGIMSIVRLPGLKAKKFVAGVKVDQNSGAAEINTHSGHVHLWFYKAFDPVNAVVTVVQRP